MALERLRRELDVERTRLGNLAELCIWSAIMATAGPIAAIAVAARHGDWDEPRLGDQFHRS